MNIKTEIVDVTPELAKEWLKVNTHNRNIRPDERDVYARDMASGNWALNGEAIKRDWNGNILDGQHRLLAVVQAGVTVRMLVVSGLAPETQETMDSGMKRTYADNLRLRGETNANHLSSITRKAWMWNQGHRVFHNRLSPTKTEQGKFLADHPELRRSVEIAMYVRGPFPYVPVSIVGAMHWVMRGIDSETAPWFFSAFATGADLDEYDPILTLRSKFISEKVNRIKPDSARQCAYIVRAWNAVREGRKLRVIAHDQGAPIPEPK